MLSGVEASAAEADGREVTDPSTALALSLRSEAVNKLTASRLSLGVGRDGHEFIDMEIVWLPIQSGCGKWRPLDGLWTRTGASAAKRAGILHERAQRAEASASRVTPTALACAPRGCSARPRTVTNLAGR